MLIDVQMAFEMKSADFVADAEKVALGSGSTSVRQVRYRLAEVQRKWSCGLQQSLQLVILQQALKSNPPYRSFSSASDAVDGINE